MSDTFDNPRDRRKHAQEKLAESLHYSTAIQQLIGGTLYMSAGRSGLSTADKIDSIKSMRESTKVAFQQAESLLEALQQAQENLDQAAAMYSQQSEQESSLDSVSNVDDFLKLVDPETAD